MDSVSLFPLINPKTHIRTVRKHPTLRKYPNFRPLISKWEELLLSNEFDVDEFIQKGLKLQHAEEEYETYSLIVDYPNNTSFFFTWNIDKLSSFICDSGMGPATLPVSYLYNEAIYEEAVVKDSVPYYPNNPIICINDVNDGHSLLCINGNNRIARARKSGIKHLEAYIFEDDSHAAFMETRFEELFWKFTSDMLKIEKVVNDSVIDKTPIPDITDDLHLFKEL